MSSLLKLSCCFLEVRRVRVHQQRAAKGRREVSALVGNISPQSVVKVGPTNLKALTNDVTLLHSLRLSYSKAVNNTLYYALGAIAITLPFALGMEWKKLEDSPQHEANGKDAKSQLPGAPISDREQHKEDVASETGMI